MRGTKIQHAVNTIKKFVEVLHSERNGKTIQHQPIHSWIYLITFNSRANLVIPFQEITDETLPIINEHLDHISTTGSTNYERGFQKQTEVLEEIIAKLQAKQESPAKTIGPFQVRTGQYGPYLMKNNNSGGKTKPVCVSIPKGTDLETLTAQQAGEIYEAGLKSKGSGKFKKFKPKDR